MLQLLARVFLERPTLADRVRPDDALASLDAHYAATTGTTATPYVGAHDMLARLKAAGERLACTTNKELRHAHRVLEARRMSPWFDLVIGGDSLDVKKPDPGVLRHVVSALSGDVRRAAHIGDSHTDVMAARNAGVAAWAVPYGYNAGRPIETSQPDRVFASLRDVAAHVLARRAGEARS
jgi:phosphoglycolate phosphatase